MLQPKKWEVIADRYRLEREIARGGMGSVWAGYDSKLRRKIAVKLVQPERGSERAPDDARERFEREAMAVAQLQSPYVVQVFDYGVERGCPYIVMELLEGEDLRTRLHRVKRVTLESAAQILVHTTKALSAAHAAGIVHRDLKPGNVFLVKNGEEEVAKILDFGVAKQRDGDLVDLTAAGGQIMGTPQFMSPEQARGVRDLDHRADLWALGVIVYRSLTGKLPFNAGSPTDVLVQVCTHQPTPVSVLAPDLPPELDPFFDRALAKDRDHRFQSAREMALAFSRISPVNFTTLSMPDPGPAIEEAIRRAAAEEDEAETLAVDASSLHGLAGLGDETRVRPAPPSSSRALPPPRLPPRRGPLSQSPRPSGPAAAPASRPAPHSGRRVPPPLPSRPAPSLPGSDRAPSTVRSTSWREAPGPAPSSESSLPTIAAEPPTALADPLGAVAEPPPAQPPPAPPRPDQLAPHQPPPSLPLALGAPAPAPTSTPHATARVEASLPSQPPPSTLEGSMLDTFDPALAPTPRSARPTLLMALAAIVVGAVAAVIGSLVINDDETRAAMDGPAAVEERAPSAPSGPGGQLQAKPATEPTPPEPDEPVAPAEPESPVAPAVPAVPEVAAAPRAEAKPTAVSRPESAPAPAPRPRPAPEPPPPPPAAPPPEPAPAPAPAPAPKSEDPFAERL